MESKNKTTITVESNVNMPIHKVWELWTKPEHITQWNFAADSWHCPSAENELKPGGRFSWRMEAKDGSMGFDFCGVYEKVIAYQHINSMLDDGRNVIIEFEDLTNKTRLIETFEAENINSLELQREGWQAILNNFKKYAEANY